MPGIVFNIKKKEGFSLIEVVLAMVIFLTVMMGFSVLTIGVVNSSKKTKMITQGNSLMIDKLEQIHSLPYSNSSISAGTHTEDYGTITGYGGFKRVVLVTEEAAPATGPPRVLGLKQIRVTVYWKQDTQQSSITYYITE